MQSASEAAVVTLEGTDEVRDRALAVPQEQQVCLARSQVRPRVHVGALQT
jgi:hypothetical protein